MTPPIRVHLCDVESEVAADLQTALASLSVENVSEDPQIVFCSAQPQILRRALQRFPGRTVIVVSRAPEVRTWIDALEAGAADYCASPFEPIHLNWILEHRHRYFLQNSSIRILAQSDREMRRLMPRPA